MACFFLIIFREQPDGQIPSLALIAYQTLDIYGCIETVSGLAKFPFRFLKWLTDEQVASTTMFCKSAKISVMGFSA